MEVIRFVQESFDSAAKPIEVYYKFSRDDSIGSYCNRSLLEVIRFVQESFDSAAKPIEVYYKFSRFVQESFDSAAKPIEVYYKFSRDDSIEKVLVLQ